MFRVWLTFYGSRCTCSGSRVFVQCVAASTENSPFSLRHVKRSWHRAPLHFLLWRYASFIVVLYSIVSRSASNASNEDFPQTSQKLVCLLIHEVAAHSWHFDIIAPFTNVFTYLLTYSPVSAAKRWDFRVRFCAQPVFNNNNKQCFNRLWTCPEWVSEWVSRV